MERQNFTIRLPGDVARRLAAFEEDRSAITTRTAAVLHLLDRALTDEGYPAKTKRRSHGSSPEAGAE